MAVNILFRKWEDLRDLQNKKLHHFITRHLYPFSEYYRRMFDENNVKPDDIRTVKDLSRLPFTSKKDFFDPANSDTKKRNLEFVLQPNEELIKKHLPKADLVKILLSNCIRGKDYYKSRLTAEYTPIFLTATTGTTKEPVSFLYTRYDIENLKSSGSRIMEVMGVKSTERAVNVFPYAPHLAFWQTVFGGFASNLFILSTGGGKTLGTDGNIRAILKVKPQFLIGVPSYVYHILKTAQEEGQDMSFLRNVILGASRVPKGFKRKVASILGEMGSRDVRVFGTYGFTESRCAWVECPTDIDVSSGYHTYPDKEVFEIIDPDTGVVRPDGADGELVYTNIDARGSCVLRYRTGDLVKGGILYSPCPHCGRTVPRISSDIVRASNIKNVQISKVKGTLVNLNSLQSLLDDKEEIDEWQIEISKKNDDPYEVDEFTLYFSVVNKGIDKNRLTQDLIRETFSITEVSFNSIRVISREEVLDKIEIETATKAKKIVDKRPEV